MCIANQQSEAHYTLCDFSSLISLLQATLWAADLINLGKMSDLMQADCMMITPTEAQATTQASEISQHATYMYAFVLADKNNKD